MSILPQLERDLHRAAERRFTATVPPRVRWWRRRRGVLSLGLAAIALVGAGGELLLSSGRPVTPAYVLPENPRLGLGRPLAASLHLLPIRTADPAGGLPWGMRVLRTSRALACIQAGRVQDGAIGGLGVGYAFKADGRFHPFAAADAIDGDSCATIDADGHAFQPGAPTIVTADGLPLAGGNIYPYERVHCDLPGQHNWGVRCPQADLREVAVGLLGPDATSIGVSTPGHDETVTPYGPDGAYLIVLPAPAHADSGSHRLLSLDAPGAATLTITFRNGSTCRLPSLTASQICRPEGLTRAGAAVPSRTRLKGATIQVRYSALLPHATPPLAVLGSAGKTISPSTKPSPGLTISFRAPIAAPNTESAYDVTLEGTSKAGCSAPRIIVSQPTAETIAVGQSMQITVPLQRDCRASYSGRLFFFATSGSHSEARTSDGADEGPLYEVLASKVAFARRGAPQPGVTIARFRTVTP
jgi:hypothetical protein